MQGTDTVLLGPAGKTALEGVTHRVAEGNETSRPVADVTATSAAALLDLLHPRDVSAHNHI